jgi:hypothetical protein
MQRIQQEAERQIDSTRDDAFPHRRLCGTHPIDEGSQLIVHAPSDAGARNENTCPNPWESTFGREERAGNEARDNAEPSGDPHTFAKEENAENGGCRNFEVQQKCNGPTRRCAQCEQHEEGRGDASENHGRGKALAVCGIDRWATSLCALRPCNRSSPERRPKVQKTGNLER